MSPTPTAALGEPGHINLTLAREVTCIRSLAWRCDLPTMSDLSISIGVADLLGGG